MRNDEKQKSLDALHPPELEKALFELLQQVAACEGDLAPPAPRKTPPKRSGQEDKQD